MSECVVRMEMPNGCHDCKLRNMVGNCPIPMFDGQDEEKVWTLEECFQRPHWCPILCQLPEGHGRLVDADAYSAEMKDRQNAAWKWRNEAIGEEDEVKLARAEGAFTAFVEAKLTWDKQATIVQAERSET